MHVLVEARGLKGSCEQQRLLLTVLVAAALIKKAAKACLP